MAEQFNLDGNIKITATEAIATLKEVGSLLTSLHEQLLNVEKKFKKSPLIKNIDSKINKANLAAQKIRTEELKTERENQKLLAQKIRNKRLEAKAESEISKSKAKQLKIDEDSQKVIKKNQKQKLDKERFDYLKDKYNSFLQSNRKLNQSDAKKVTNNTFSNIKTNAGLNSIDSRMILALRRQQLSEEAKLKKQQLKIDEDSQKVLKRALKQNIDAGRFNSLKDKYTSFLQSNRKLSQSDAQKVANNTFSNIKTNAGLNSIDSRMILALRRQQLSEEQKIRREQERQNRELGKQRGTHGSILDKIFNIKNALIAIAASNVVSTLSQTIKDLIEIGNRVQAADIKFKALSDSSAEARDQSSWIWERAKELRVPILEAVEGYSQFYAAAKDSLPAERIKQVYDGLLQTSVVLHLNRDRFKLASLAFEQMLSKGTVSMEELRRQLGEHIPGAFIIAAKAMGTSQKELNDLIKGGKLASDEFLIKFAPALIKAFGSEVPEALQTSQSKVQALLNSITIAQKQFLEAGFSDMVGDIADSLRKLVENREGMQSLIHLSRIFYHIFTLIDNLVQKLSPILNPVLDRFEKFLNYLDRKTMAENDISRYGIGARDSQDIRLFKHTGWYGDLPINRSMARNIVITNNINTQDNPKSIQKAVEKGNAPITGGQAFQNAKIGLPQY